MNSKNFLRTCCLVSIDLLYSDSSHPVLTSHQKKSLLKNSKCCRLCSSCRTFPENLKVQLGFRTNRSSSCWSAASETNRTFSFYSHLVCYPYLNPCYSLKCLLAQEKTRKVSVLVR